MIIRLIESDLKHVVSFNLSDHYSIRSAERLLSHFSEPDVGVDHTGIWSKSSIVGDLTLGDIFLGRVKLSSFVFSCQMFVGESFTLHSLFDDLDFNPYMIFSENEPISFLFRSKHLHFNLPRTLIEKTEPYGHILDKGFYIKEVIVTRKKIEILG